jgi:hypothetical protein
MKPAKLILVSRERREEVSPGEMVSNSREAIVTRPSRHLKEHIAHSAEFDFQGFLHASRRPRRRPMVEPLRHAGERLLRVPAYAIDIDRLRGRHDGIPCKCGQEE